MSNPAYILDNGAYTAKVGFSSFKEAKIIPNCIMKVKSERRRPFIGNQVDDCRDASGLFYMLPFQKGYLVNWDIEKTVWDYIFGKECCPVNFTQTPLVVTEPLFNFRSAQEAMTEIFFEEYECSSLLRINATDLACFQYCKETSGAQCCLVVDSGYSFTHIVPYIAGKKLKKAIHRINVGGKVLTNHLKEIISYRQLNVMDETYVVNQVKEDSCFVSSDFYADMNITRLRGPANTIARDYVLPDYTTVRRGYLRTPDASDADPDADKQQTLRLGNERFAVPEILFHPSDIGILQMGIPEAIEAVVENCPEETRPHLYANIVLVGGCCLFPGFRERVEKEVRTLAPVEFDVHVTLPTNCLGYPWKGGISLSQSADFLSLSVSREEYEEEGHNVCLERFDI